MNVLSLDDSDHILFPIFDIPFTDFVLSLQQNQYSPTVI